MATVAVDPLTHDPARRRVVASLAALPRGDALSVTRLQDMTGLIPGSLITCLRELGHAGYARTGKPGGGAPATVALTRGGRAGWTATPRCSDSWPGWPGRIIGRQHPACALAMPTGTRSPRPRASTSRTAG